MSWYNKLKIQTYLGVLSSTINKHQYNTTPVSSMKYNKVQKFTKGWKNLRLYICILNITLDCI